jgi:hypothetical protein
MEVNAAVAMGPEDAWTAAEPAANPAHDRFHPVICRNSTTVFGLHHC